MAAFSNQVLVEIVKGLNTVRYAQLAAGAFFVYDWLLTLGMEVELIWRSKWNYIKVLYLFQRYLTFYDTFYASYKLQFGTNMSSEMCGGLFTQMGVSYMIGIIASETLCSLRIWAVWNQDKRFYVVYPICVVCIWIPATVAMASAIQNSKYADAPYYGFMGCLTVNAKAIHLEYVWAALLAYDAISLVFVIIPGVQLYRHGIMGHSRLSNVVFRDGVIYYITLFIFSLLNIIFTLTLPVATRSSLANMGRALHSTLASRVLLHMRDTVHVDDDLLGDNNRGRSNVHFTRTTHHDHGRLGGNDGQEEFTQTTTYSSDIFPKE